MTSDIFFSLDFVFKLENNVCVPITFIIERFLKWKKANRTHTDNLSSLLMYGIRVRAALPMSRQNDLSATTWSFMFLCYLVFIPSCVCLVQFRSVPNNEKRPTIIPARLCKVNSLLRKTAEFCDCVVLSASICDYYLSALKFVA